MSKNPLKTQMPVLAQHEGVWEGTYRYVDNDGKTTDVHKAKLVCRFPEDGDHLYHQTNHYTWDDGRTEVRDFPATVKDGRLYWDNDLIQGWAADVDLDDLGRTTMLQWTRTGDASVTLYEMIQISPCGNHRARTWQWFKDGIIFQRTLINETRISHDWEGH